MDIKDFEYRRKINYYETDKMGIVHHSNYIRYLEEARSVWLEEINMPMAKLESEGITIPVLEVICKYVKPVTVGDVIVIKPYITDFTGVRFSVGYDVREEKSGNVIIEATTKHCFTDMNIKPISLKRASVNYYNIFNSLKRE